jgi:hypothetical protein
MGGWVSIRRDKVFVGFGPNLECPHCHNNGWQEVWQRYMQQWAYSVIPTPKIYSAFIVQCPICHWGFEIRKKDKPRVAEILAAGKEATKRGFQTMTDKEKSRLLKHLNRNGFIEISQLLAFNGPVVA